MDRLWIDDQRVAPWRGTAYGVLAAANTYAHHYAPVRGATRVERNAERLVTGKVHDLDRHNLQVLAAVGGGREPRLSRRGGAPVVYRQVAPVQDRARQDTEDHGSESQRPTAVCGRGPHRADPAHAAGWVSREPFLRPRPTV